MNGTTLRKRNGTNFNKKKVDFLKTREEFLRNKITIASRRHSSLQNRDLSNESGGGGDNTRPSSQLLVQKFLD